MKDENTSILGERNHGKDVEVKRRVVMVPEVKKADLLGAFERMCRTLGKTSRGFDVGAIDGKDQWAMKYRKQCGWMVVCGLGGCGCALSRWNGYTQTRWNFLMLLETVNHAHWKETT